MDSSNDAIVCPVCYGLYDDPRNLPCGHSFCWKCLSQIAGSRRNFPCPSCRADVQLDFKGVKGLPKNYGLDYIVEGHTKMSSALCKEHNKSLEIFCEQCDVMICLKCLFSSHSGHKIQEMDDVFNKRKEILTELLESTKPWQAQIEEKTDEIRSSRQSVEKAANAIKTKIDVRFGKWSDDLENQRQTLQRYVDEKTAQRMKVFDDHLTVLASANTVVNNFQTEMNTTLSKDTTSVVQLYGSMKESHQTVRMKASKATRTSFTPPPNLKIDISGPWMEEAIQNIKPFDVVQGKTNSVVRTISVILKENETLERDVRRLQYKVKECQLTMKDTTKREKDKLEDERRKNKELIDELEMEKRRQGLRNAELRKNVDELMENITQTSLAQCELFKKRLEDNDKSLIRRTKKKFSFQRLNSSLETVRPSASSGGRDDYGRLKRSTFKSFIHSRERSASF